MYRPYITIAPIPDPDSTTTPIPLVIQCDTLSFSLESLAKRYSDLKSSYTVSSYKPIYQVPFSSLSEALEMSVIKRATDKFERRPVNPLPIQNAILTKADITEFGNVLKTFENSLLKNLFSSYFIEQITFAIMRGVPYTNYADSEYLIAQDSFAFTHSNNISASQHSRSSVPAISKILKAASECIKVTNLHNDRFTIKVETDAFYLSGNEIFVSAEDISDCIPAVSHLLTFPTNKDESKLAIEIECCIANSISDAKEITIQETKNETFIKGSIQITRPVKIKGQTSIIVDPHHLSAREVYNYFSSNPEQALLLIGHFFTGRPFVVSPMLVCNNISYNLTALFPKDYLSCSADPNHDDAKLINMSPNSSQDSIHPRCYIKFEDFNADNYYNSTLSLPHTCSSLYTSDLLSPTPGYLHQVGLFKSKELKNASVLDEHVLTHFAPLLQVMRYPRRNYHSYSAIKRYKTPSGDFFVIRTIYGNDIVKVVEYNDEADDLFNISNWKKVSFPTLRELKYLKDNSSSPTSSYIPLIAKVNPANA